jgi:hypothetical protein
MIAKACSVRNFWAKRPGDCVREWRLAGDLSDASIGNRLKRRFKTMARVSLPAFALVGTYLLAAPMLHAQTKVPAENMAKAPSQKGTEVQLSSIETPLVFEPNKGQGASEFNWIGRGAGFRVGIGANGATIEFRDTSATTAPEPAIPDLKQLEKAREKSKSAKSTLVKLHLTGSSGWKVDGTGPTGGISNYFIGNTAANWHTDIPQYAQVKATGVYQGIDLVFHGNESALEYDFVVGPGADPKQIQIQFEGAASLKVDKASGDLVLSAPSGVELRHEQPKIYQEVGGKKISVGGGFAVKGDTAGFTVEKYDPKYPLVIDPTISFVRFLGGSDTDQAAAVAVDGLGNTYVTGSTYSGNFPAYGGVVDGSKSGDSDAFVTKLGAQGSILFSTFLGGGDDDHGQGITVDASGVYVAGQSWSDDFPRRQAFQYDRHGDADIFVTKLSPTGNRLVYSTYLGGKNGENWGSITEDASQSAYVSGYTTSPDFPVILGSYDTAEPNGGFTPRGFISKLSPAGTELVYSTYLAGSGPVDSISAIAIDGSLSAYVTGETCSPDFPFAGHQSNEFSGGCSTFVTKLSPGGDSLIYSTSLGETTIGAGVAVDSTGNAYIAGSYCGGCDKNSGSFAYVAKLRPSGKLSYLTYLNGSDGSSWGQGIGLDSYGDAYVVGSTTSMTFPGAPPVTPNPTAGFLVMTRLDRGRSTLFSLVQRLAAWHWLRLVHAR